MIEEYLAKKLVDAAAGKAASILKKSSRHESPTIDLEGSLAHHIKELNTWSSSVSFADLHRPRTTSKIFVELSLYVYPRRLRVDDREEVPVFQLKKAIESVANSAHVVLLGQPGAGKTTAMKYLCRRILLESDFLSDRISTPLVIRLRELNERSRQRKAGPGIVFEALQEILGVSLPSSGDLKTGVSPAALREQVVVAALEELGVLLVLDGFDELATDKARTSVLDDVRKLARLLEKSILIITSRSADFSYTLDNCHSIELAPLSSNQIEEFAYRWLGKSEKARGFLEDVGNSPFSDTQIRPLNLAHLLAIYDRVGRIPERPKTVYRKIVQLLLEDWDEQRSVRRRSSYAGFEVDRKFEFLSALAFILTTRQNRMVFSSEDMLRAYSQICVDFNLPRSSGRVVLDEIEGHTGLLVRSGHDLFEFCHKSIQEYLAAEHIVRLPSIPSSSRTLSRIPNEMAIAVAISSRPAAYFAELVFHRLTRISVGPDFFTPFVNRLLLEKTDFERHLDASLAFLALYSLYRKTLMRKPAQLSLFVREELIPQFEELALALIKIPIANGVLAGYELEELVDSLDGIKVGVFRRTGTPHPKAVRLPEVLYIRQGLLPSLEGGLPGALNRVNRAD